MAKQPEAIQCECCGKALTWTRYHNGAGDPLCQGCWIEIYVDNLDDYDFGEVDDDDWGDEGREHPII